MISVEEALHLVHSQSLPSLPIRLVNLEDALGHVLAEDVVAPISLPSFLQSSMDGYAVSLYDQETYEIVGEVKAGDGITYELKPGQAVRIFTGAKVPDSANAVVMQEKTDVAGHRLTILEQPANGLNIRKVGEQVQAGMTTLKKGHRISSASVGFIGSLGLTNIAVYETPKVSIVVTGNELSERGRPLEDGKVYESNAVALTAALQQLGMHPLYIRYSEDSLDATKEVLYKSMLDSDLILVSGGISVGDYDFVGKALEELGVETIFYKVAQRPGKPLFFGRKENTFVFALPGNPASSLNCFYMYVWPFIQHWMQQPQIDLPKFTLPVQNTIKSQPRAQFLKAFHQGNTVAILDQQASSMTWSFAEANALVYIPADGRDREIGDMVEVLLLPF